MLHLCEIEYLEGMIEINASGLAKYIQNQFRELPSIAISHGLIFYFPNTTNRSNQIYREYLEE